MGREGPGGTRCERQTKDMGTSVSHRIRICPRFRFPTQTRRTPHLLWRIALWVYKLNTRTSVALNHDVNTLNTGFIMAAA